MFSKLNIGAIIFLTIVNYQQLCGNTKDSIQIVDSMKLTIVLEKAESYFKLAKYDSALFFYEKAEKICLRESIQDSATVIKILDKIGTLCFNLHKTDQAYNVIINTSKLTLAYYGQLSIEYAKSLISLSTILIYFQKYDDAYVYLQISKEIYLKDSLKYEKELAKLASNLSCIYRGQGIYDKAFESIHEGIEILNGLPEDYERNIALFKSYINQGNVYSSFSLYEKALDAYIKALNLKTTLKPKDDNTLLILYNNISVVYLESGDNKNLLNSSFEAYNLCKKTGENDFRMMANILNAISVAYLNMDSIEKSKYYINEALRMVEKQNNKLNLISSFVYQNFGNFYRKLGITDSAKTYYEKSLDIDLKLVGKNHLYTALNYKNLGDINVDQFQIDSAITNYLESYKIYDTINIMPNIKYLDLLSCLASVYYKKGSYLEAEKFLLLSDAKIREYQNNSPQTEAMNNSLLHMSNNLCKISYLNSLMLCRDSNYYESLDKSRAVKLIKESKDKIFIYELADSIEKANYNLFKENLYFNQLSLRIASENGYLDQVARLTLKNKSWSDSITSLKNSILSDKMTLFQENELGLLSNKLELQINDSQLIICYLVYKDTLWINLITNKGYEIFKTPIKADWRNKINNYLTLISGNNKDIYKLDKNGEQYFYTRDQIIDELGAKNFAGYLFDGNRPVGADDYTRYLDSFSGFFYNMVITPVESKIKDYKELVIMPDEELDILPFMSLYTIEKGEKHYLVENSNIRYVNSLSIYLDKNYRTDKYKKEKGKELLAIGISKYKEVKNNKILSEIDDKEKEKKNELSAQLKTRGEIQYNLSNLAYTKLEIDNITYKMSPSDFDILYDSLATEAQIKNMNRKNSLLGYKKIHIATHGFLEDKETFGGGLAMYDSKISGPARNGENDGYLSFFEILKLNLRADLVVLSACNTGRGRLVEGEGIYGLNYAFYMAGANNIISSLWEIDDKTTSAFFSEFYARIGKAETYSQALNNIGRIFVAHNKGIPYPCEIYSESLKKTLRSKSYFQPYYWAAFTLW